MISGLCLLIRNSNGHKLEIHIKEERRIRKMKMTKKKVLLAALAICIVAILSVGTLAWFNASDSATNTFYVATDKDHPNPEFSVKVTETDPEGEEVEEGVTYYNVVPGAAISKDPTVANTGHYGQWIRATVTLQQADLWYACGGSLKFTDLFEGEGITYGLVENVGEDGIDWLLVNEIAIVNEETGVGVWYLYLNRELLAESGEESSAVVFDTVHIPENFDMEDVEEMGFQFEITIKADALQSANTGDNAVEAFENVGWAPGTEYVDIDFN